MPHDAADTVPRGLILSSAETPYAKGLNFDFVAKLNKRLGKAGRLEWHNYHEVGMTFSDGKIRAFLLPGKLALNTFKFVYFKSYLRYHEQAAAITEYLDAENVRFLSSEARHYMPQTKLTQLARLARAGLSIPRTIYLPPSNLAKSYGYLRETLGTPIVLKAIDGSSGRDNHLVKSARQLRGILREAPDLHFIAQEFIPNTNDLRILVVGKRIELIIRRRRRDDSTHLNNTSQGADVSLVPIGDLAPADQKLALRAAALMRRETAGVDLLFSSATGKPYVLEVNTSPQIASGAYTDEKLEIYSRFFRNMLE
jgi:glutathione synthase/RimK-type ligase-like ATP-grasp enzyme